MKPDTSSELIRQAEPMVEGGSVTDKEGARLEGAAIQAEFEAEARRHELCLRAPDFAAKRFFTDLRIITLLIFMTVELVAAVLVGWCGIVETPLWLRCLVFNCLILGEIQSVLLLGSLAYFAQIGSYFKINGATGESVFEGVGAITVRLDELRRREAFLLVTAKQVFAWRQALRQHLSDYGAELRDSYVGWEPWIAPSEAMPVFPKKTPNPN